MKMTIRPVVTVALLLFAGTACGTGERAHEATYQTQEAEYRAQGADREPDVMFVPTPEPVVQAMLKMADVKPGDMVYDLGSGDGRIVINAAKNFGARGIGVDIDPKRVKEARRNVKRAGVESRVRIVQGDLFEMDLSKASVVTLYLLQRLNEKLRPKLLRELRPGTRIVSQTFDMGDWKPVDTATVNGTDIYMWIVPERK